MEGIIIIALVILLLFSFFNNSRLVEKNRKIRIDVETLQRRILEETNRNLYYERIIEEFNNQGVFRTKQYSQNNNNNPQIIEAIKYAMKKSHPDNGGNAEDFKKFRDLYIYITV